MKQVWDWSFLIAPLLLYVVGVGIKHLGSQSKRIQWDHTFFSQEIAISNAGSVLSAFVVTAKSQSRGDDGKWLVLIALAVVAVVVIVVVTVFHRSFDDHPPMVRERFQREDGAAVLPDGNAPEPKSRMCIFMLGFLANMIAIAALSATLYYTTGAQPSTTERMPIDNGKLLNQGFK